ncbi:MAG: hypothetical protein JKZ00_07300 [Flavobacteriaceae bacterium]|nr:hypothetical protein [Flavobacteriaceae bacterium]
MNSTQKVNLIGVLKGNDTRIRQKVGNMNLSRSNVLNGVVVFQVIWFSIEKYNAEISKTTLLKILKRSLIIFLSTLFLNLYLNFNEISISGVYDNNKLSILQTNSTINNIRIIVIQF